MVLAKMRDHRPMTRRRWLARVAAASVLGPRTAWAAPGTWGQTTAPIRLDLPQLRYPGPWQPRPGAMRELAVETRLRTRLEPVSEPSTVRADGTRLFASPFLYVAGARALPNLGAAAEARLRAFVSMGGLIVFDAADGGADLAFRDSVTALVTRLLPGARLAPLHREHVLFRSFYILDRPVGRTAAGDLLATQDMGRIQVLFVPSDLGGALARRPDGLYAHPCVPGGAAQRARAIRLGVNILLYATCLDYKADPAHVETLLRARRWR